MKSPFSKQNFIRLLSYHTINVLCIQLWKCTIIHTYVGHDMGFGYVDIQRSPYGGWPSQVLHSMMHYLHKHYSDCVLNRYASRYI